MNKSSKFSHFIDIQHLFFFHISIGLIANNALLLFYVLAFLLEHRPKPTDMTIGHLAFIHIVMLLTVSFIATDLFGFKYLGDDIICVAVIYLHRVMRGLSVCTTCLLSVLQAITLSSRSSCLAQFKHKSLQQNLCCFLFLWVFNMFINSRFLISTGAISNVTSHNLMFLTQSCCLWPINYLLKYLYLSLMTFQDVSCIGLMALSSGYMVILLYRHKRQSKHLYNTRLSPKTSPEERATRTILLLTSFFIVMYFLDCFITYTSGILWISDPIHHCVQLLVCNGYATVSPLVLTSTEKRMINYFISKWRKKSKHLFIQP